MNISFISTKLSRISVSLLVGLVLFLQSAIAQDISFDAEVSTNRAVVGNPIQLTLIIRGTQKISPKQLPPIDGFDIQYQNSSQRFTTINGQFEGSVSFQYSLVPLKVGNYGIPALKLAIDGKDYTTQPISIEVVDSAGGVSSPSQGTQTSLDDRIFVRLETSKQEVYLNDRVPIKMLLYIANVDVDDIQYPQLEHAGFTVEKDDQYKKYQQIIQGVRYTIFEFNTFAYPTRLGALTLGPVQIECNLIVRNQNRRSSSGRGRGVFDDDFFSGFFDRVEKRPVTLKSDPITLNVLPLPEDGRPQDFSGAVGNFNFDVSVGPRELKVGDPITLRMKIRGNGNLKAVEFPSFANQDEFKLYDPIIKEENNTKILEQVIVPKSDQIETVLAIQFSYFDINYGKYRTITRGPFPIKVEKSDQGEGVKVIGLGELATSIVPPEKLGQDIVFIKDSAGTFRAKGAWLYRRVGFYIFLFVMGIFWGVAYIFYKQTHRLKTDTVYARRMQAPRHARKGLMHAKKLLEEGKREDYYTTIFKTLQNYLGNKFHLSSGAVTFETIEEILLNKQGADMASVRNRLKIIFDECDMIRYASGQITAKDMQENYQKVEQIIDYLERHVK